MPLYNDISNLNCRLFKSSIYMKEWFRTLHAIHTQSRLSLCLTGISDQSAVQPVFPPSKDNRLTRLSCLSWPCKSSSIHVCLIYYYCVKHFLFQMFCLKMGSQVFVEKWIQLAWVDSPKRILYKYSISAFTYVRQKMEYWISSKTSHRQSNQKWQDILSVSVRQSWAYCKST